MNDKGRQRACRAVIEAHPAGAESKKEDMNSQARMQSQRSSSASLPKMGGVLQRKCACGSHTSTGGKCGSCSKQREANPLQRAATNSKPVNEVPAIVNEVLRSPGQPLDPGSRALFEPHFAHDFSRVRVHTDARAIESARAVNAMAYTVGQDLVFGAGQFAPQTGEGKRLLAHELTHVVQQQGLSSTGELSLGAPDSTAEREADEVSRGFARHSRGGSPLPPLRAKVSRDLQPALRRWSIGGNTATSDDDSDTLGGLAIKAGARFNDWKCIKPVSQRTSTYTRPPANFDARYELYVQKGDTFDISNLTATTGTTLRIYLFDDATEANDAAIAKRFYPGSVSSLGADEDIEGTSGSGSTPIANMVVFGHAAGDTMWGAASRFTPRSFAPEEPKQSFTLAAAGLFPRRCWFTREASVRAVGCNSAAFGEDFSRHYLRKGSSITSTTNSVRPTCSAPLNIGGTCRSFDGLDFAASPSSTAARLAGPFTSVTAFHGAGFWRTIRGKL
jgi:hypothetical protein